MLELGFLGPMVSDRHHLWLPTHLRISVRQPITRERTPARVTTRDLASRFIAHDARLALTCMAGWVHLSSLHAGIGA